MTELLKKLRHRLRRRSTVAPSRRSPKVVRRQEQLHFYIRLGCALVLGLTVFFWFTSARILNERVEVSYGPRDATFVQSLGPLLGAEFAEGNSVKMLLNGDEIFPEMLAAIRSAKKTITLESYIWASGKISDQFIDALTERAQAKVAIHVMVDGMGTLKFKRSDQQRLRDAGVVLMTYGREHWYEIKPNINHRTHRKIMVVDGRVGFTGGMCIDDHWIGNADSPKVWRETGVKVEGPVVVQMQGAFATNWLQTTGRLITGPDYFPVLPRAGESRAQVFKSGPGEDPENARISYMLAIASARRSIKIEHAYFVPDDLATEMLLAARKRGVEIEVIIPAINDSRFGRAASRSRWGPLLAAGVTFHQFQPSMLHAKIMIVDDAFVTLGSVNFDNRSFAINDEMNINFVDPVAAEAYVRSFEIDKKKSKALTLEEFESRPFWIKGADWFCGIFRSQL